jgi:6-phosphofructokinase 1
VNTTTIGVLTSGGDAPGMNAAIRAIVRTALHHRVKVYGIRHGYNGMVFNDVVVLDRTSVANIIQRGGTILGTARSAEFKTVSGMKKAKAAIDKNGINGIIVIGGDGTMRGAHEFSKKYGIRMVGLPGTIDNDLYGTDFTIGFDTAVNSALEAVDRIRDSAASLERIFYIEVMGRCAGFIGLTVGLAGGAEEVLVPETPTDIPSLARKIIENRKKGKKFNIIIVAEGDEAGDAFTVAKKVKAIVKEEYRVAVLGYIQRGGAPTANDRNLASTLGYHAVQALRKNKTGCMLGVINNNVVHTPFRQTFTKRKKIDPLVYKIIKTLSE